MRVVDLQKYLSNFNPDAEVKIVVNNTPRPFDLAFGSAEGCTKHAADNVAFMIGGTDEQETNRGFWKDLQRILEKPCERCQELQQQVDAQYAHCQNVQQQLTLWQELCERYGETDLSIQNLKQAHDYLSDDVT